MHRWILIGLSATVVIGAIGGYLATRPTPFDAFPASPPSPSIAPDGTTTFTIDPGTQVSFPPGSIAEGERIVCTGKGRTTIPSLGSSTITIGAIRIWLGWNGSISASCAPHPLAEIEDL